MIGEAIGKHFLFKGTQKRKQYYICASLLILKSTSMAHNSMKTSQLIKLGRLTAIVSIFLGSIIFLLYFLTSEDIFLLAGLFFVVFAVLSNIGILISLLLRANKDEKGREKLLNTAGLMLLNIPVVYLYCWFIAILLDNMRVTFRNCTTSTLRDINIIGCENEHINELAVNECKTVWIKITGDCSITINYITNGVSKNEEVLGYVTNNMGQKLQYSIGKPNDAE
jgi:amino acid transporter